MDSNFIMGLDLGQAQDYTAVGVLEQMKAPTDARAKSVAPGQFVKIHYQYHLRHLERCRLGTPYPEVVARVKDLMTAKELVGKTTLVVDATGVGRPVVDLLRAESLGPVPVVIHGGDQVVHDNETGFWRVLKRELVSTAKVLLQGDKLKFAADLPSVKTLVEELLKFEVKITESGNDAYGAWREGAHDDQVFAVALACWWGERQARGRTAMERGTYSWTTKSTMRYPTPQPWGTGR